MKEKTDNELIAEFMGLPLTKTELEFSGKGKLKTVPFQRWKYDTSWDWLMPAVEKIESLKVGTNWINDKVYLKAYPSVKIGLHYAKFVSTTSMSWDIADSSGATKIKAVYKAVVEFIKWYNNQQAK